MVIIKYKKSGKVLKLWHVNANSVDVMRLNILRWGLLDPIGTSRVEHNSLPLELLIFSPRLGTAGREVVVSLSSRASNGLVFGEQKTSVLRM